MGDSFAIYGGKRCDHRAKVTPIFIPYSIASHKDTRAVKNPKIVREKTSDGMLKRHFDHR